MQHQDSQDLPSFDEVASHPSSLPSYPESRPILVLTNKEDGNMELDCQERFRQDMELTILSEFHIQCPSPEIAVCIFFFVSHIFLTDLLGVCFPNYADRLCSEASHWSRNSGLV
jgi:hypothetical protein